MAMASTDNMATVSDPTAGDTTTASKTTANGRTPLLRLPAELRNNIWEKILVMEEPIDIESDLVVDNFRKNLFPVCHQIRSEACAVYHEQNTFIIDFDLAESAFLASEGGVKSADADPPAGMKWLAAIPEVDRRIMRSVTIPYALAHESSHWWKHANPGWAKRRAVGIAEVLKFLIEHGLSPAAITFKWQVMRCDALEYGEEKVISACRLLCDSLLDQTSSVPQTRGIEVHFPDENDFAEWHALPSEYQGDCGHWSVYDYERDYSWDYDSDDSDLGPGYL